uniref:EGF-like domain-containing protein n=1 Tax=Pithovirus LCPAC403 TaxID=2506596 RepID=A0A481ZAP0_9VIRU|nr:MAG: hypothetical protein LCPAC403_01120 [Pithovirus LCPAC403]
MEKEQHRFLPDPALMGIMTIILIIIVIVIWVSISSVTLHKQPASVVADAPIPLTIDDPIGASTNGIYTLSDDGDFFTDSASCKLASNTQWSHLQCTCIVPFFGDKCTRESYNSTYFAVGNPTTSDVTFDVLSSPVVDSLSFPTDSISCTGECDMDPLCTGIIFRSTCTLLTGDVIVNTGAMIPYSMDIDSTLYLKTDDRHLIFTDRVFVYTGTLPARYYLRTGVFSSSAGQMIPIFQGDIINLSFFPVKQLNVSTLTGVYSENEITQDMLNQISQGIILPGIILVQPNVVDLPDFSQFSSLWVAYIAQV